MFACVADIGWITGHTYVVYGPLSNGATSVIFESTPTYPDASQLIDFTCVCVCVCFVLSFNEITECYEGCSIYVY